MCGRDKVCAKCGKKEEHAYEACPSQAPVCFHCGGGHAASSKSCPEYHREKQIIKFKIENSVSFPEARKKFPKPNAPLYSAVAKSVPQLIAHEVQTLYTFPDHDVARHRVFTNEQLNDLPAFVYKPSQKSTAKSTGTGTSDILRKDDQIQKLKQIITTQQDQIKELENKLNRAIDPVGSASEEDMDASSSLRATTDLKRRLSSSDKPPQSGDGDFPPLTKDDNSLKKQRVSPNDQGPGTHGDTITDGVTSGSDPPKGDDISVEGGRDRDTSFSPTDTGDTIYHQEGSWFNDEYGNKFDRYYAVNNRKVECGCVYNVGTDNKMHALIVDCETEPPCKFELLLKSWYPDTPPTPQCDGTDSKLETQDKSKSVPRSEREVEKSSSTPKAGQSKAKSSSSNRVTKPGKTYKGLSKSLPEKSKSFKPIVWN